MRVIFALLSWLLVFFPFACGGGDPLPSDLPPPAFPPEEPATPGLSCPTYAGEHAFPEMAPLASVAAAPIGAVDGSFSVSSSGSATYTIPFALPPGRQIEPHLGITYDSSVDCCRCTVSKVERRPCAGGAGYR